MVLESGKITEEGIQRLRERLGRFNRPRQYGVGLFNEQATRDAIRHYCQGIGDPNPLYWDVSYGQRTKYGTIIAPPCFLYSVLHSTVRPAGLRLQQRGHYRDHQDFNGRPDRGSV